MELSKCHVTQSSTLAAAALEAQVPTVVLSASASAFWLHCGAQGLEPQIKIETRLQGRNTRATDRGRTGIR